MRPDRLNEVISGGENLSVEFKDILSDRELVEAVVCLVNRPDNASKRL
jgi:hypothetical protein